MEGRILFLARVLFVLFRRLCIGRIIVLVALIFVVFNDLFGLDLLVAHAIGLLLASCHLLTIIRVVFPYRTALPRAEILRDKKLLLIRWIRLFLTVSIIVHRRGRWHRHIIHGLPYHLIIFLHIFLFHIFFVIVIVLLLLIIDNLILIMMMMMLICRCGV